MIEITDVFFKLKTESSYKTQPLRVAIIQLLSEAGMTTKQITDLIDCTQSIISLSLRNKVKGWDTYKSMLSKQYKDYYRESVNDYVREVVRPSQKEAV